MWTVKGHPVHWCCYFPAGPRGVFSSLLTDRVTQHHGLFSAGYSDELNFFPEYWQSVLLFFFIPTAGLPAGCVENCNLTCLTWTCWAQVIKDSSSFCLFRSPSSSSNLLAWFPFTTPHMHYVGPCSSSHFTVQPWENDLQWRDTQKIYWFPEGEIQ